jgi:pimeloyl-ACP methyl ester carboxylesterase
LRFWFLSKRTATTTAARNKDGNPLNTNHNPALPPAVHAERLELTLSRDVADVRISYYRAGPPVASGLPPLLLVHSVNAVGSAAEVAPLFEHYRTTRAVYALDLPGFGLSSRTDRAYTPRLMTDAVLAMIAQMRIDNGGVPVDVLGVSLASEFVARAQRDAPASIRRIALVSPTGFSRPKRRYGPPESNLGQAWLYKVFTWPFWTDGIYRNLTRPSVIRYFLKRTQGSKTIDEALWAYDVLTAQQPGAKHAPYYFVSAYLFSKDTRAAKPYQANQTGGFMRSMAGLCPILMTWLRLMLFWSRF